MIDMEAVRRHLSVMRSELARGDLSANQLLKQMQLVKERNGRLVPKNVALLMFCRGKLTRFFPGAFIQLTQYYESGETQQSYSFDESLVAQLRACLKQVREIVESCRPTKDDLQWVAYPFRALIESIVNAAYHRAYDGLLASNPVRIDVRPNSISVVSHPGVHPAITLDMLRGTAEMRDVPARNRRVGEFLKECRLAEARGTGIPAMRCAMSMCGLAPPEFRISADTFEVRLAVHPAFVDRTILDKAAALALTGHRAQAIAELRELLRRRPGYGEALVACLDAVARSRPVNVALARSLVNAYSEALTAAPQNCSKASEVTSALNAVYDAARIPLAQRHLAFLKPALCVNDKVAEAQLMLAVRNPSAAHRLLEALPTEVFQNNASACLLYAKCKTAITRSVSTPGVHGWGSNCDTPKARIRTKLLREAADLLERVLSMDPSNAEARHLLDNVEKWKVSVDHYAPRLDGSPSPPSHGSRGRGTLQ